MFSTNYRTVFNGIFKLVFLAVSFQALWISAGGIAPARANIAPAIGDYKVLVILGYFSDTPKPATTPSQINSVVFGDTNSYYQENSYGKVSLSGSVVGWYALPKSRDCNTGLSGALVFMQAADAEVDFNDYSRIIFIAPYGCGIVAVEDGSLRPYNTPDGTVSLALIHLNSSFATNRPLIAHELGHTFGLDHANFYNCGEVSYAETGCTVLNYSDPYSVMSKTNLYHFNAMHKDYLGWFGETNIQEVTMNGTYAIEPLETATVGRKAIKIKRKTDGYLSGTDDDYLWVEYRQPIGFDSGIGAGNNVLDGALLHFSAGLTPLAANKKFSLLIDPSPPGSALSAALTIGQSFRDPANGATVTAISKSGSGMSLSVSLGKTDFTSPAVSITAPIGGQAVSGKFSIAVSASDASGIKKVEFYRLLSDDAPFAVDTTAPYEALFDASSLPNGTNVLLQARAYDRSGEAHSAYDNWKDSTIVSVIASNNDLIPPTVILINPVNGSVVANPVQFSADAMDNVAIKQVVFYTDGMPWNWAAPPTFTAQQTLSVGTHTAYAEAWDTANLKTLSNTVTFTVSNSTPTPTPASTPSPTPTPSPAATSLPTPTPVPCTGCCTSITFVPFGGCGTITFSDAENFEVVSDRCDAHCETAVVAAQCLNGQFTPATGVCRPEPTPTPTSPPASCTDPAFSPWPSGWARPCPVLKISAPVVQKTGTLAVTVAPQTSQAAYIYKTLYIFDPSWNCPGKFVTTEGNWCPMTLPGPLEATGNFLSINTGSTLILDSQILQNLSIGSHYLASWDWTWDAQAGTAGCYRSPEGICSDLNPQGYRLQAFEVW